ncbi:MAG: ABC transporter permease [Chloroflexota bacterium]
MSAPSAGAVQARPAPHWGRWARRNAWTLGVYVLLIVLLIVAKIIHPTLGSFDMQSLVNGALPLSMAAMAQAVVVLAGGIDLSVGSMMSLVNVVSALLMTSTDIKGALLVSALLIVATAAAGALTGLLITITGVPDIIVTLATSFVWAGLALHVMPTPGGGAPAEFVSMLTGEIGSNLPSGLIALIAVVAVIWLPFRRSRSGLAIYAMGSNRTAAFLSGVNVTSTRIISYAVGGAFAAMGGLVLTATTSNGSAVAGNLYTLNSVAAIVLGGVSLTGGRGGMIGPLAAAFVLTLATAMLTFLGVDPNWGQVIQGTLIVLVVMLGGLVLVRGPQRSGLADMRQASTLVTGALRIARARQAGRPGWSGPLVLW